jgi:acetylornithine deacetylase/succinyl-diaminopimelate desuccinylase-like protein
LSLPAEPSSNFDFVQACRKLISFDTSPAQSTVDLVNELANLGRQFGLDVEIQNEIQNGISQANIFVRCQPFTPGDQEFLLQTHLDTVDPGSFSLWKKNSFNPFDAVIENGQIFGLGAAEVKLDFLCKLKALIDLKSLNFKNLKPVLVGTFGEESGMQGALKLIRKNKINAKYALIGEPTNLNIVNSAKGFATVEIKIPISPEELKYKSEKLISESVSTQTKIFSGRSAHSSTPHRGESAAVKMFEFLSQMPKHIAIIDMDAGTRVNMIPNQAMVELDASAYIQDASIQKINVLFNAMNAVQDRMRQIVDTNFEPQYSTLSVGVVRTHSDHIFIGGSCRILPTVSQDTYESWMGIIDKACIEVGAQFSLLDYKRPFRTNENSVFIKAAQAELEKLGIDSQCQSLASTNEASIFSRLGIECLCLGAGQREGNVHTPNEYVNITDLEKAIIFYTRMIERFCL